jgi:threonylcarbamoyladenosine tRNA methylthiotransferase MtaB
MPQVQPEIRKERAARLRTLGDAQLDIFLRKNINKDLEVVVEKGNIGRAENFSAVRLDRTEAPGALIRVRTIGVEKGALIGHSMD